MNQVAEQKLIGASEVARQLKAAGLPYGHPWQGVRNWGYRVSLGSGSRHRMTMDQADLDAYIEDRLAVEAAMPPLPPASRHWQSMCRHVDRRMILDRNIRSICQARGWDSPPKWLGLNCRVSENEGKNF